MLKCLPAAALLTASLMVTAQAGTPSILRPIEPQVRAIVHHAQPNTEFGTGPDIFMADYRTSNHVYQAKNSAGQPLPAQVQYGPRRGGFYLMLTVAKAHGGSAVQMTPPSAAAPWSTVVSTYPMAHGGSMIVMTWEATSGAPRGLAARVRAVLLRYTGHAG